MESFLGRFLHLLFAVFIVFPLYIILYISAFTLVDSFFINRMYNIPLSGTGSMYPTFPKGSNENQNERSEETVAYPLMIRYPNGLEILGNRYFLYEPQRGDIVSFTNAATDSVTMNENGKATGFVKRIIGMPGDVIELREGLVYINGFPVKEPYTAIPRSTFGGKFLADCTSIEIPENNYFVMGDNRKSSNDSRFDIGFVKFSDIDFILPLNEQLGVWDKNWRDTDKDLSDSSKIRFNDEEFIRVVNEKRNKLGITPLTRIARLNNSALLRARAILAHNDFSFDGEVSNYSMQKALADSGYTNVTYGEIPIQGYYSVDELLDYIFQFPETAGFILREDFQDIGISVYEGDLKKCPTQIIVLHLAGYKAPNYSKGMVNSWDDLLRNLKDIQPGWSELKEYDSIYKSNKKEIDRINEIISTRISNVEGIVRTLKANQWLSSDQEKYMKLDETLSKEQSELADLLNRRVR
jgi:signal peptidase I